MEWARGIVVSEGELWAEVESVNGAPRLVTLAELYRRGIPAVEKSLRRTIKVDFRAFSSCDPHRYSSHFGIPTSDEKAGGHQIFEVHHDGNTYLVPALALMRALFRPTPKLLPEMFAPAALERTLRLDYLNGVANIVFDAKWATSPTQEHTSNWRGALSWMISHPTARAMADSVHRHAMLGHIALDLANCGAEIVFAGVRGPDAVLVTAVRILSITPCEPPDLPVARSEHPIEFIERTRAKGRNIWDALSVEIPTNSDGAYELNDDEWLVIGPLLASERRRAQPSRLCQRSLFDSILRKLGTGEPWKRSSYSVGDWRTAATTYRTWKLRGTFEQALVFLRQVR